MHLKPAMFLAVSQFGQRGLDAVVEPDHLLVALARPDPNGSRPGDVGKRSGAADIQLERSELGRPKFDGPTDTRNLALMHLAEKF